MEDVILRGEVYSKIHILLKQYNLLLNQEFPSKGSESLTKLIISILEIIEERFSLYSPKQIKHICNNFFQYIEEICGYLIESEISKVPWSIIPAIDRLFKNLLAGFEFVVVPIWESNYKIFNKNILELFKDKIISTQDLLFDADENFDSKVASFLNECPKGIYMIFFPKIERKSALHFALLGHEIGHKYALEWWQNNFANFFKNEELEKKFRQIAEGEIKEFDRTIDPTTLFGSVLVDIRVKYYNNIASKIVSELISDIFGTLLFGETTLIASYLFSIKKNLDDTTNWTDGYLSWRYRIQLVNYVLERVLKKNKKAFKLKGSKWVSILTKCLEKDYQDGKKNRDNYLNEILNSIENIKEKMCDDMERAINGNLFLHFLNDMQISEARKRIADRITPNSYIEGKKEMPIEFTNILYASWLALSENINSDSQEYMSISNIINLLSIKGIELSIEQEAFNNRGSQNDTNKK